jgi:hypothetical protein
MSSQSTVTSNRFDVLNVDKAMSKKQAIQGTKVNTKPSKAAATKLSAVNLVKEKNMRTWPAIRRFPTLATVEVSIVIGDEPVAQVPKGLVVAASVQGDKLVQDGKVVLPAGTDKVAVLRLIEYLRYVARSTQAPEAMSPNLTTRESLAVTAAAKALGMEVYVDHIYKMIEGYLRKGMPTYVDLDAIVEFKDTHPRLFNIVAKDLAIAVWDATIPDSEAFTTYLTKHPALNDAIALANTRHAEALKVKAEQHQTFLEREARRSQQKEVAAGRAAKAMATQAAWDRKNATRKALEQSVKQKSSGSLDKRVKFTADERAHWVSTRGKEPPKGC